MPRCVADRTEWASEDYDERAYFTPNPTVKLVGYSRSSDRHFIGLWRKHSYHLHATRRAKYRRSPHKLAGYFFNYEMDSALQAIAPRGGFLACPTSQHSSSLQPPITRYGTNGGAFIRFWPNTMTVQWFVLRAGDAVVEQPAQMLRPTCGGVRPKHDDVRKLAILGALDCHDKMTALLPEAQTRTIAHGLPHERSDLRGGEGRLPMRAAQTVHAADGLRDRRVCGQGS